MKNVAVFFHPFKKYEQVAERKWVASHFINWYRIYHDGKFIVTHIGRPRRHLGISPNSPHYLAMAEALRDPCFDRFDNPLNTICLMSMHKPVHLRIQSYLLGNQETINPNDESFQKIAKTGLGMIDRNRTVPLCAEKGSLLRQLLPNGDVFENASTVVSDQIANASVAANIEFCCNRAIDRHREHLMRLNNLFSEEQSLEEDCDDLPF
jgi:hypothetical protein